MAELMPNDYVPTRRSSGGGYSGSGELVDARDLARANPGRWVQVGEPRKLDKPPSSWVSEVNLGQKQCLTGVPSEAWEATWEWADGTRIIKLIRLKVTPVAPEVPPGFTPETWAAIPDADKEVILAGQQRPE